MTTATPRPLSFQLTPRQRPLNELEKLRIIVGVGFLTVVAAFFPFIQDAHAALARELAPKEAVFHAVKDLREAAADGVAEPNDVSLGTPYAPASIKVGEIVAWDNGMPVFQDISSPTWDTFAIQLVDQSISSTYSYVWDERSGEAYVTP